MAVTVGFETLFLSRNKRTSAEYRQILITDGHLKMGKSASDVPNMCPSTGPAILADKSAIASPSGTSYRLDMSAPLLPEGTKVSDLDPDTFYTPEQIAPIIGINKTALRRYCRESKINTRLTKNTMALTLDNIRALHAWIVAHDAPENQPADYDPWSKRKGD